jgi:hypothetical protein
MMLRQLADRVAKARLHHPPALDWVDPHNFSLFFVIFSSSGVTMHRGATQQAEKEPTVDQSPVAARED